MIAVLSIMLYYVGSLMPPSLFRLIKSHPSRNKLNRQLDIFSDEIVLECPVYEDIKLKAGGKLLLCSDGVLGVLEDAQMIAILSEKDSAEVRAKTRTADNRKTVLTSLNISEPLLGE